MTKNYLREIASSDKFGVFWKLLFKWKGSVYKMIWLDLLSFTVLYSIFALVYRNGLSKQEKLNFERYVLYCREYVSSIPLKFLLGFYVSMVVQRWWGQFEMLPWPNTLAILTSNYIKGTDERARLLRRTVVRYANLAAVLTVRKVSPTFAQSRFPTLDKLVDEGFLQESELPRLSKATDEEQKGAYWIPLVWAINLIDTARKEQYVLTDLAEKVLVQEICAFRGKCAGLLAYDMICIPLVYTQVVTIAVYSYLYATTMASQFVIKNDELDIYVPVMTYLELIFYIGWMKVAESLVNPFGKDDQDFDVDRLITNNLKNSYLYVDKMMDSHPELMKDCHWSEYNQDFLEEKASNSSKKEQRNQQEENESLLLEVHPTIPL